MIDSTTNGMTSVYSQNHHKVITGLRLSVYLKGDQYAHYRYWCI